MEKKENENVTKRMNSGMFKHAVCVCAPGGAIAGIFIGFNGSCHKILLWFCMVLCVNKME